MNVFELPAEDLVLIQACPYIHLYASLGTLVFYISFLLRFGTVIEIEKQEKATEMDFLNKFLVVLKWGKGQNLDFLLEITLNEELTVFSFPVFQEKHHIWETSVSRLKSQNAISYRNWSIFLVFQHEDIYHIHTFFWRNMFPWSLEKYVSLMFGEICFLDVWGNMFPWCFYFSLWLIWLLVFENLFWRYSRGDGPGGLRRYTENRKDPSWNPTRPSAGLCVQPPYEALGDIRVESRIKRSD